MLQFFKGWRRKTGCVTLALSCALLSASLQRASTTAMIVGRPVENGTSRSNQVFEVSCAGITWEHYDFPFRSGDYGQGAALKYDVYFYRNISKARKCHWRWNICGIEAGEYKVAPDLWFARKYVVIPSESVALVFAALSAWLLPRNPRPTVARATVTIEDGGNAC